MKLQNASQSLNKSKITPVLKHFFSHSILGLSVAERQEIGFRCKRVLDMGRVAYLQSMGLQAQLVYYVDRTISPENAVLIATPKQH